MSDLRITRENARFQQWEALLTNRSKRHRNREFLVQGVRPITLAIEHGWTIRVLISNGRPRLSSTSRAWTRVITPSRVMSCTPGRPPTELA